MWEIEARLREAKAAADLAQATADAALASPGGDTLPDQAGHGGEFLTTDGAATSWGVPAGGSGNAIYIEEGSAAEGDSSAADLTLDFSGTDFDITTAAQTCTITVNDGGIAHSGLSGTHNLTTDIDHDTITNGHNLTTDIDHDALTNTHNLTTDIDHSALSNLTTGDPHTQYVLESLFDAQTVLAATSDNTPAALTVAEKTVVGRVAGGNVAALTAAQISTLMGHSCKAKTAATTRNNTDVYAADPHLVSFALEASSYYSFMGKITVTDSGTNDYKLRLVGNQNYTGSGTVQLGTVNAKDVDVTAGTTMTFGQINVTSGAAISHFSGWIITSAALSLDVEWAQFFASAADTTLHAGSCFEFYKIAQV